MVSLNARHELSIQQKQQFRKWIGKFLIELRNVVGTITDTPVMTSFRML